MNDSSQKPHILNDYLKAKYDKRMTNYDPKMGALHTEIGEVGQENVKLMRIVHISDTHLRHREFIDAIPSGDVLVHSGDFTNHRHTERATTIHSLTHEQNLKQEVAEMNEFFSHLPHKHKIFVAGNHETLISKFPMRTIQKLLTSAIYLQDSSVTIDDIHFYGSPWTYCSGMGFPIGSTPAENIWKKIPADTDILVTHLPPRGIMDLALKEGARSHWGCRHLRDHILKRIRPKAHLYGHVHDEHGVMIQDGVLFSNAAMDTDNTPIVIDFFYTPKQHTKEDKIHDSPIPGDRKGGKTSCVLI